MYIFPEMIDLGFAGKPKWQSPAHRKVAQNVLLANPLIDSRDALIKGVSLINSIPLTKIKKVTICDLTKLGFTARLGVL